MSSTDLDQVEHPPTRVDEAADWGLESLKGIMPREGPWGGGKGARLIIWAGSLFNSLVVVGVFIYVDTILYTSTRFPGVSLHFQPLGQLDMDQMEGT